MKLKTIPILLFLTIAFFSCEKEDEGKFNIEITNPFNQAILIKGSALVSTSIPSYGSVSLTGAAGEGSLYAVDLYCDDDCPILGEQGSVNGNITFNFIESENYTWTAGQNSLGTSGNGNSNCTNWKDCVYKQPNLLEPIHGTIYDNKFHTCLNGVLDDAGTPSAIQWQSENKGIYTFTYPSGDSFVLNIEYVPNNQHVLIYVEGTTPTIYEYTEDTFPCQ